MNTKESLIQELHAVANKEKAIILKKFFRAIPEGYGGDDEFLGVSVPQQRKIATAFYEKMSSAEMGELLDSRVHEHRLTALFILVLRYEKAKTDAERQAVVDLYLNKMGCVNNWDLVDSSAYKILGPHLLHRDKQMLYDFAQSGDLWKQRIAIIATLHFIKNDSYVDTLKLSELLLKHPHDLIHKAVGWMLREVGKRNYDVEFAFLKKHYANMPRTMLRYAIERFDPEVRKTFLTGEVY